MLAFTLDADHPRVGGEHMKTPVSSGLPIRIIPAWAGNTPAPSTIISRASDHPRVGGEHSPGLLPGLDNRGSSPRGRGTQTRPDGHTTSSHIIPAWAGNTGKVYSKARSRSDHPRVGGEHSLR